VHGGEEGRILESVSVPIFQTATFSRHAIGEGSGYDYTRLQNPTREALEKRMASLDGGCDAIALSSGMAAIALVMELFSPGDHILVSDDLYGGTIRLFNTISRKNGLSFSEFESEEGIGALIRNETKAIFLETPTNPTMKVFDIERIAKEAKERGLRLIVDNTFLTPRYQRPLALGADIVVYSATKYLAGHNDTLAGIVSTKSEMLSMLLRNLFVTTGGALSPFDSWLVLRGLKTLSLRMERSTASAQKIAAFLAGHPSIGEVRYPGQGGMISLYAASEEIARRTLEKLRLVSFAESLGGCESLMTYPMTQTHADVPRAELEKRGINEKLLRLSVGIEDAGDLVSDLDQALR
jgi:cystathionine gamma-synthase